MTRWVWAALAAVGWVAVIWAVFAAVWCAVEIMDVLDEVAR